MKVLALLMLLLASLTQVSSSEGLLVSKTVLLVVGRTSSESADLAAKLRQVALGKQLDQAAMPIVRFVATEPKVPVYMMRLGFDSGALPVVAIVEWSDEGDEFGPKRIVSDETFREVALADTYTLTRAVDHWRFRTGRLAELPESKEKAQVVIQSFEGEIARPGLAAVRIRVQNQGRLVLQGPIKITVSARTQGGTWAEVHQHNIDKIVGGWTVTRESTEACQGTTEFKAVVALANGQSLEKEFSMAGTGAPMAIARSAAIAPPQTLSVAELLSLGRGQYAAQHYREAIDFFSQVAQRDSQSCPAFLFRGLSRFQLQDYQNAITDFNEAIRLEPQTASTYSIRAVARMQLNDLQGALADYNKIIELEPANARAFRDRGWLRRRLADSAGATQDLSKAKALDPSLKMEE